MHERVVIVHRTARGAEQLPVGTHLLLQQLL
jgi:hypothetical protein